MLTFGVEDKVAVLRLDDGKANAVGHQFIDSMNEGLDRAENEASSVVILGRAGVFSAGFDLKVLSEGAEARKALVDKGAAMLLRLFRYPLPVITASSGHAIAAGALVLLAADSRLGANTESKYGLNETAIGMSLPPFGLEMAKCRISKRYQTEAIIQATLYSPEDAKKVGFIDEVVDQTALEQRAIDIAAKCAELPSQAYSQMKNDLRKDFIERIEASLVS